MADKTKTVRHTISLPVLLTGIFLVLKLVGEISWGWFWVLSPIIISVGIGFSVLLIMLILSVLASVLDGK